MPIKEIGKFQSMESIMFIFAVLAVLMALLIVIVVYKMALKQKNINLLKEQLLNERRQNIKGDAEFTAMASGMGAAGTSPPIPKNDQHFHPSC